MPTTIATSIASPINSVTIREGIGHAKSGSASVPLLSWRGKAPKGSGHLSCDTPFAQGVADLSGMCGDRAIEGGRLGGVGSPRSMVRRVGTVARRRKAAGQLPQLSVTESGAAFAHHTNYPTATMATADMVAPIDTPAITPRAGAVSDPPADTMVNNKRRPRRGLAWHLFSTYHQACDQGDFEVAELLLAVLAMVVAGRLHQPTAPDPHNTEILVAAYERLWNLRHPNAAGGSDAPG